MRALECSVHRDESCIGWIDDLREPIPPETGLSKAFRLLKPSGSLALFRNHPFVGRADDPVHRVIQLTFRDVGDRLAVHDKMVHHLARKPV